MKQGYNLTEFISIIKEDIISLINTKLQLLKLEVFEKSSAVGSILILGVVVVNLVFFTLLFAFLALGFLLGQWVGSLAGGFGLVTLIYLVLLVILLVCRKPIMRAFQNIFLKEFDPDLSEGNDYGKAEKSEYINKKEHYECK